MRGALTAHNDPVAHFHQNVQALGRCLGVDPRPAPPVLKSGDRIRITQCNDPDLPLWVTWEVDMVLDDFVIVKGHEAALSHGMFGDRWELVPHDVTVVS